VINEYTIVTNNGHIHTNDDILTAKGIDTDDVIDGRYPLEPDVKLIMVLKNGKDYWAMWDRSQGIL
jgi:hypothetical protein